MLLAPKQLEAVVQEAAEVVLLGIGGGGGGGASVLIVSGCELEAVGVALLVLVPALLGGALGIGILSSILGSAGKFA